MRQADGIPLTIELTAARANILTVEEISEQLHNSFAILASDNRTTVSRHQTLQASMDWIWSLLTDSEQVYLQHLSVFAGGWTLEAAEVICDGDANEAISISRELGDLRGAIGQLEALAHAEVLHEEFATAQRHLKDGIQIWVLYSLEGLADLFTRTLQYESAACLIGFADATRERSNEPREPITEADVDKVIFAVKEKIGSSMFELAYISGRGMTMDEAVALALREQQPISTNN